MVQRPNDVGDPVIARNPEVHYCLLNFFLLRGYYGNKEQQRTPLYEYNERRPFMLQELQPDRILIYPKGRYSIVGAIIDRYYRIYPPIWEELQYQRALSNQRRRDREVEVVDPVLRQDIVSHLRGWGYDYLTGNEAGNPVIHEVDDPMNIAIAIRYAEIYLSVKDYYEEMYAKLKEYIDARGD